jgi:hypothetical protein
MNSREIVNAALFVLGFFLLMLFIFGMAYLLCFGKAVCR